jgi:hypothetical protein
MRMVFQRVVATLIERPPDGFMVTFTDSDGAPDTIVSWFAHDMDGALDWVETVVQQSTLVVAPLAQDGAYSVSVLEDEA